MLFNRLKISKIFIIGIALAVLLAGVSVRGTSANHQNVRELCESSGGNWIPNPNDIIGACWGGNEGEFLDLGTFGIAACSIGEYLKRDITSHAEGTNECFTSSPFAAVGASSSSSPGPGPTKLGKCKLLSIDSLLNIGTSFSASWIGTIDSIRFRQTGAGIIFVPLTAGTVHFEDGHRAGEFFAFGLDRGRWEATCFGPGGTFGTAKIVFVK